MTVENFEPGVIDTSRVTESFGFQHRTDEPLTLEAAVAQALGEASVCWENMSGAGVFDSSHAKTVADRLVAAIRSGTLVDGHNGGKLVDELVLDWMRAHLDGDAQPLTLTAEQEQFIGSWANLMAARMRSQHRGLGPVRAFVDEYDCPECKAPRGENCRILLGRGGVHAARITGVVTAAGGDNS